MLQQLEEQGWNIRADAYQELVDDADGNAALVLKDIINQDLKKIGRASLPDDVNRTSINVKGPVVLQISSITDVSRPTTRESAAGGGADRLLSIRLTDGKVSCKAIEYQRVDQLNEDLPPGTKVLLSNANVKNGMMMLNPKNIKVLGGRVEHLAEAWETQRRYGGVERPKATGPGDDGEMAPPFRHFIPGRDDKAAKLSGRTAACTPKPATPVAAVLPAASKAMAAGAGVGAAAPSTSGVEKDGAPAVARSPVAVAPVGPLFAGGAASEAAKRKLQDQLEAREEQSGRTGRFGGRGRGGFRRGRRGGGEDDDDGGAMTLEEWEAMKKAKAAAASAGPQAVNQLEADEALARQMQAELDLEDSYYSVPADQAARSGDREGGRYGRDYGAGGERGRRGRYRGRDDDSSSRGGGAAGGRAGFGGQHGDERRGRGGRGAAAVGNWVTESVSESEHRSGGGSWVDRRVDDVAQGSGGFDRARGGGPGRGAGRGGGGGGRIGGAGGGKADERRGYESGSGHGRPEPRGDRGGGERNDNSNRSSDMAWPSSALPGPAVVVPAAAAAATAAMAAATAAASRGAAASGTGGLRGPPHKQVGTGTEAGSPSEPRGGGASRARQGDVRESRGRDSPHADGTRVGSGRGGVEATRRSVSAAQEGTAAAAPAAEPSSRARVMAAGPSGGAAAAAAAALAAVIRGAAPSPMPSGTGAAPAPRLQPQPSRPAGRELSQPQPQPPLQQQQRPPAFQPPAAPGLNGRELTASMFNFGTRSGDVTVHEEGDGGEGDGRSGGARGRRGRGGRGRGRGGGF
ncbi:hypothetical protein Vafri_128 [Volvox africanus]|nr:hypothetical protein Vafri_128 [Volvox africanus]